MISSKSWTVVLAVWLAGCAGSAPPLRNGRPAVMTREEACRDPTALVLLCGERACAFYRCRAVAPDEDASVQAAAPAKVVLAQAVVVEEAEETEEEEEKGVERPATASSTKWWVPHAIGLPDTAPVFEMAWGPSSRPHPLPPGLHAGAQVPHALHHVFPPEQELRAWFASKGIDPEAWTMPIPAEDYFRIHEGAEGDSWRAAWRNFMRATPEATAADVWNHAGELCLRFGLLEPVAGPAAIAPPKVAGEEPMTSVALDPATRARVDKALAECAGLASSVVLARRFNGKSPTPRDCREQVGQDTKGTPITLAQELGREMHKVALECARERLEKLRPFGFSIEQRYRSDPRTGRAIPITFEEEETLLSQGRLGELLGTIVPDIVLHAGNLARVQLVYDFKFPCVHPEEDPPWRMYPPGHPYQKQYQDEVYWKVLGVSPAAVTPRKGVIR